MTAFWQGNGADFCAADGDAIIGELSRHQVWHFRVTEAARTPAWRNSILVLQQALRALRMAGHDSYVLLEYPILRLGKRIDAVVLTDHAILVLEFKREQVGAEAMRQVEDYALDLFEFHEHSRRHAVVPVLVTEAVLAACDTALPLPCGVLPVQVMHPAALGAGLVALLRHVGTPSAALDFRLWQAGAYRPVPTIIEAACMLYARHGVEEIKAARADQRNLHETTEAIRAGIAQASRNGDKIILFVTGIPGAGKTLCGLHAALADDAQRGVFLTGNPTLVHVLREALARDATTRGMDAVVSRRRMLGVIQKLPDFRNHYVTHPDEVPAETVLVIDEAQRCWSASHAIRKTRDKPVQLCDSEPGHLLDIAARRPGFAALICLIGSGQEIHDGEGGLAEWGGALRTRPEWKVLAAQDGQAAVDPRRKIGSIASLRLDARLHLDVSVRQIRSIAAAEWVEAVLRDDATEARRIAADAPGVPFSITRDLASLRDGLRLLARGARRAGLLASAGAKRLRAEGLGAELAHMDPASVAHWFLDWFPADIRASDALELVATEFSCQGLELDYVGLCWDGDLVRGGDGRRWLPRQFGGTKWQIIRNREAITNQLNTYRVLLTRARYETIVFVPRGDARDATRDPTLYDQVADYLVRCGAGDWADNAPAEAGGNAVPAEFLLL